jgi:glutathione synthase/RimK-type ligase-like ATP-grasp enzyme
MMLAIHQNKGGFTSRWRDYCDRKGIPYQLVNCYANDLIAQLHGCTALLWHHSQGNPKDILIAKPILFALEQAGIPVFPDFRTNWHFDDKLGQKYLLEAIGAPLVPTYVFYERQAALDWAAQTSFPKVWKLRGGAGSANVQLVRSRAAAARKIRRAFGRGFPRYDAWGSLRERWRKFRQGQAGGFEVLKGLARLVYPPAYARTAGRERGYVYFQDFIPGNDSDTRVIVIADKAFALKRMVRKGDFRASGSGDFRHERAAFDEGCIALAFDLSRRLGAQCLAYDFVFDEQGQPLVVEISYGFSPHGYDDCPGYWDEELRWHEGAFDPYGWMVESIMNAVSDF